MKSTSKKIPLYDYESDNGRKKSAFIEIANEAKGGEATFGGSSIRKTVYDESGRFDNPSSHELPTNDICIMVVEGAKDNVFTLDECIRMIAALSQSLLESSDKG